MDKECAAGTPAIAGQAQPIAGRPAASQAITNEMVFAALAPRAPESHKGSYGRVLAVCGCPAYRGAAALSALGALRAGAGIVTLAAPEAVIASVAARILEATFLPLPEDAVVASAMLADAARKATVCLGGCGHEPDETAAREMRLLLHHASSTVVLDAGGLCSLAAEPDTLHMAAGRLIITPHPGEMARLANRPVAHILQAPADIACGMAKRLGAVVVLKGHRTLVATPAGQLYENRTGNAGLARGGSGDVLAGIIAGLAAQGLTPVQAAVCGVYLHGLAADRCAARLSMQGMLPEDILSDLCAVYLENGR